MNGLEPDRTASPSNLSLLSDLALAAEAEDGGKQA